MVASQPGVCWNATSRVANSEWHELGLSHFFFRPIDQIEVTVMETAQVDYWPGENHMECDGLPAYEDTVGIDSVFVLVGSGCMTWSMLLCI